MLKTEIIIATGMAWPGLVSSDKWKAPLVNAVSSVANELESGVNNN